MSAPDPRLRELTARARAVETSLAARPAIAIAAENLGLLGDRPQQLIRAGQRVIVLTPDSAAAHLLYQRTGILYGSRGAEKLNLRYDRREGLELIHLPLPRADHSTAETHDFLGAAVPLALRAVLGTQSAAPELIELHGPRFASAVVYLGHDPHFASSQIIFVVHDASPDHQGRCDAGALPALRFHGLDLYYPGGPAEFFGQLNFLKLGMVESHGTLLCGRAIDGDRGGFEGIIEALAAEDRIASSTSIAGDLAFYRALAQRSRPEDPNRFPPTITDSELEELEAGTSTGVARILGARELTLDGCQGFAFAVWAPNAKKISVAGEWNSWNPRRHPMRRLGRSGVFEVFIPGVRPGQKYEYHVLDARGELTRRSDPCARSAELRPGTASITCGSSAYRWNDGAWMEARARANPCARPVSVYELHAPSWQPAAEREFMNYRELADRLVIYLHAHGFTHVELMGLLEHPLDESWGYQVTGYYAPTSRHGSPEDFKYFVDTLHQAGIGVLFDWVPAHFPKNRTALAGFDGTHLYDHEDDRLGEHADWGTRIFNYGRHEVRSFLIGSALHFLREFHLDGVRVDAVASMLYLDYSRNPGSWIPNRFGGRENLEAVEFLRELNRRIAAEFPGVMRVAEDSTMWPGVTDPQGLGFGFKWDMGWMNDTLRWFQLPPELRAGRIGELTKTFLWAHDERHVAALSHDEVVHGKRSLLGRMPGDASERFANLRLLYGYMWSYPGHKLLFMGGELAQEAEWRCKSALDWPAAGDRESERRAGVQRLVADLNALYRSKPALYERQFERSATEVIHRDADRGVLAILRRGHREEDAVLFVHNFTAEPWTEFSLPVEDPRRYSVIFCSDDGRYGGTGSRAILPPLSTVAFERR